jgi:hypothetical protein
MLPEYNSIFNRLEHLDKVKVMLLFSDKKLGPGIIHMRDQSGITIKWVNIK